ncbi:MAG: minor capsid protein [Lentisphaeraceae bacterium]|nr:minor capsid protein [Lentisphaeraceae bacterium]
MTANPFFDSAVRRQALIERLKASETQEFFKSFKEIEKLLKSSFSELDSDLIDSNVKELNKFIAQVNRDLREVLEPYKQDYYNDLEELAEVTAVTTGSDLYNNIGKAKAVNVLANGVAASKSFSTPMNPNGKLLKPFFDRMTNQEVLRVTDEVRKGYQQGRTNSEMVRSLVGTKARQYKDGVLDISKRNATALIRTSTQHVASVARIETFKNNTDIVSSYKIIATLDSRTSSQCRSLDNQVFEFGKGPITPIHIGCRSTMTPELSDEFSFLSEGRTRSSNDGQISSKSSYYDWLKKQPKSTQLEVLGRDRFDLFNKKGMTAERFRSLQLDKSFQPLTLAEMKDIDSDAFIKPKRGKKPTFKDRKKSIDSLILQGDESALKEAIKMPEDFRSSIVIKNVTPKARDSVDKATDFLNELLPPDTGDLISRGVRRARMSQGRGHYTPHNKELVTSGRVTTTIHEMSHAIEFQSPKIAKASNDFLKSRAGDERPKKLRHLTNFNYAHNEIAYEDSFAKNGGSHYMGKIYKGPATEIITMGMERLYKEPLKFAKDDPEYFDFMIKTLQHQEEL